MPPPSPLQLDYTLQSCLSLWRDTKISNIPPSVFYQYLQLILSTDSMRQGILLRILTISHHFLRHRRDINYQFLIFTSRPGELEQWFLFLKKKLGVTKHPLPFQSWLVIIRRLQPWSLCSVLHWVRTQGAILIIDHHNCMVLTYNTVQYGTVHISYM